ncbi:MAG TPA: amphi-Trp domain-containing protein [Pyrinomonadaceae bacterium]|nr:amphi-Trp domain-containing protein [Pyrinomonadaceae bacterium]
MANQASDQPHRDIERVYSVSEFVAKLRRLADALESEKAFEIKVAGERLYIPAKASFSVEHERTAGGDELEFQLRW